MDFLLECIGFSPDVSEADLVALILESGEAAPWRGDPEHHQVLALGGGLEVRADRDEEAGFWTLTPQFRVGHRLRMAVTSIVRHPDSPFDALLTGWASPPIAALDERGPGAREKREPSAPGAYGFSTWITDARRLGSRIAPGHVLAVSVAGFAVNVERVIPNEAVQNPAILEAPAGASIRPLGTRDAPGGCCDVSLRIQAVRHIRNELTGRTVDIAICDAPGRPLHMFLSPWQLEGDGQPKPRPGMRIEGTFMFAGRIAGGLPRRQAK